MGEVVDYYLAKVEKDVASTVLSKEAAPFGDEASVVTHTWASVSS